MRAILTVLALAVSSGVLILTGGSVQVANAEPQLTEWRCYQTDYSPFRVMSSKSFRGCPLGTILEFNLNVYPPESIDGWDGGCANEKSILGWSFTRIKSSCRLREFGGPR